MFKGGTLEYKCRRCGVISKNFHAPKLLQTIVGLIFNIKGDLGTTVHMLETHNCEDGGIGVSDLIGGIEDKE